ncbi:helix-turn-helix domain-containing protein [Ruminococcus albus]|uniref:Uncharacterized protein n=1 Tax=Ruminococcus albus TaxID=1264 RepID=A0A1H7N0T5_RUMAL|nr:helix-turn-helix transcriptional regulator [Ruminococcus albus]SEL16929.1 hypothetical protein SAMN05216469_11359 [Ruminococcus albus]
MLSKKVAFLLKKLGVENSVIAGYAGCGPANFCRLRSGSRNYTGKSTTVKKFVEGVYYYCCDNSRLSELCGIIKCSEMTEDKIISALTVWLFDGKDTPYDTDESPESNIFGNKLCSLMDIAELSNKELSGMIGVDPSYISRMRNGERVPLRNSGLLMKLCSAIAESIDSEQKVMRLNELMGAKDDKAKTERSEQIFMWLSSREMPANMQSVKWLIKMLNDIPDVPEKYDMPEVPPYEIKSEYFGAKGLQQCCTRFLDNIIKNNSREILLYSDINIDWLTWDYGSLWINLMKVCYNLGTHIKIIHSIDRSVHEMIEAIISWLPLYVLGQIEPYYSTAPVGGRFACSIIIDPNNACIQSYGARDSASGSEYSYITKEKGIGRNIRVFDALLSKCRPLLEISEPITPSENTEVFMFGKVQLCFEDDRVYINKLSSPARSFTFTYEPMKQAFRSFANCKSEL